MTTLAEVILAIMVGFILSGIIIAIKAPPYVFNVHSIDWVFVVIFLLCFIFVRLLFRARNSNSG